jgi:hypothetical protein
LAWVPPVPVGSNSDNNSINSDNNNDDGFIVDEINK